MITAIVAAVVYFLLVGFLFNRGRNLLQVAKRTVLLFVILVAVIFLRDFINK